jgi:hypothetical protein
MVPCFIMATLSSKPCSFGSDIADASGARARLRDQVRNIGKRDRHNKKKQGQPSLDDMTLPPLAILIGVLSKYDIAMVVDFLIGRGASQPSPFESHSVIDLKVWVEQSFINIADEVLLDLLELQGLGEKETKKARAQLFTACKYVVENRLFLWTRNQNCAKGVAPGREQLTQAALNSIPVDSPAMVIEDVRRPLCGSPRTQRKWLSSYRKRWGARIGKLQPREHLEPDVIKAKAQVQNIYSVTVDLAQTCRFL